MAQRALLARKIAVVLLVCIFAGAQVAAFASEQLHQHSAQHCCALCHAGPLPFLQATVSWMFAPCDTVTWLDPPTELSQSHTPPISFGESRAPPAL